jgi:uncharacterized protein YpuA (DUF1002 family)
MLTIYKTQLSILSDAKKEEFIQKMASLLRSEIEEVAELNDIELKHEIEKQISKAKQYGLNLNSSLTTYIITAFLMGENFDTDFNRANEILMSLFEQEKKCRDLEKWAYDIFNALENN